jgi:galactokinase
VSTDRNRILAAFREAFGSPALLVAGPGRVNLIGEHTDYNQGFVLPAAVDKTIWVAVRPRPDRTCRFRSVDLDEAGEFRLEGLVPVPARWANYLLGVYSELAARGMELPGVDCAFGGDVPIGSGMSSSAALECAFAFALDRLFGLGLDPKSLALLGQACENRFVGVNCGIMDQFASVLGRRGSLIQLDCRDLSHRYVPFERDDLRVVVCDTQVRRALAGSEYNVRRAQCEAGVARLAQDRPGIRSLRDVEPDHLEARRKDLDPRVHRRCAYVVAENGRVLEACAALERKDFRTFGRLMNASHAGLRDDYEVSCRELDILARAAQASPGVLGSRMMGAGFGGCTISLVEEAALDGFRASMAPAFRELGVEPVIHVCALTDGTRSLPLEA